MSLLRDSPYKKHTKCQEKKSVRKSQCNNGCTVTYLQ